MPALAITDHGNMYGVKEFFKFAGKHVDKATGHFKVKPIIGCEVYVHATMIRNSRTASTDPIITSSCWPRTSTATRT